VAAYPAGGESGVLLFYVQEGAGAAWRGPPRAVSRPGAYRRVWGYTTEQGGVVRTPAGGEQAGCIASSMGLHYRAGRRGGGRGPGERGARGGGGDTAHTGR